MVLDQQPKEVFGLGPQFWREQLRQLHPSLHADRWILKGGDQDVVLEQLVKPGQLGAPGIDRIRLLRHLKDAGRVATPDVARLRHESPPPR
jgi:hypothetical protein